MQRKRKYNIGTVVAWSVIILAMLFVVPGILGYMETHYMRNGNIVAINGDTITVKDEGGECWQYDVENGNEYKIGESVKMRMSTNYTDFSFYDDIVEDVKPTH